MREIRTYGSEGGGSLDLPTPMCAEHVRQLGGESPLHNLMEVK
jgi:hypothetical protein